MACEGPIKEPGLRRFVILHGAVEVKVVPTKGRKCHGSERGAVYPMLSQGVGGNLEGRGINSSFAVDQDFTGRARERCIALGIAIGSGFLFETTFKKEVYSDLTGERGVLMGAIYGLWLAQYEVLREKGHSPSEAFNETVEEATQSLSLIHISEPTRRRESGKKESA